MTGNDIWVHCNRTNLVLTTFKVDSADFRAKGIATRSTMKCKDSENLLPTIVWQVFVADDRHTSDDV